MTGQILPSCIGRLIDKSLAKPTRVHRLPSFEDGRSWTKREDELSSGISGSKLRKYSSLLPYLKSHSISRVALIGGPNSNNLVGLIQVLRENGIQPIAFIRAPADSKTQGNALFLDMLLSDHEKVFVPRNRWESVHEFIRDHLKPLSINPNTFHLLEEGCFGSESLLGAMSLAEDLLRNESDEDIQFDRVYIDSGTGMSAIGLIIGLELLSDTEAQYHREVVVTLIAGNKSEFLKKLQYSREQLTTSFGLSIKSLPYIRFLIPKIAPKFGSVNRSLFQETKRIARTEGLLMDPTYSVKHYLSMEADLKDNPSFEKSLFIFNGSALGLSGFQNRLESV